MSGVPAGNKDADQDVGDTRGIGRPPAPPGSVVRRRLSFRLLLLTLAVVALVELCVFLPGLARERHGWLTARIARSNIVAVSAAASAAPLPASVQAELLRLAGTRSVTLRDPDGSTFAVRGDLPPGRLRIIDLHEETATGGLRRALAVLIGPGNRTMQVMAASPFRNGAEIELLMPESSLRNALLAYARGFLWIAVPIAALTGAFVYFAVFLLLVRPIRQLTDSIVAFRADPERTPPLDMRRLKSLPGGEISIAATELAVMQRELRTALWRNARLAALGAAIAKVSHDLRNSLSPALMIGERLERHADPAVRRAGVTLQRAVDDAVDLVTRMLQFAREVPPQTHIAPVPLAALVGEVAAALAESGMNALVNQIDPALEVRADRTLLRRVLSNLVRNAIEAGAVQVAVRLGVSEKPGIIAVDVADDGPGLPDGVRAQLFKPFATSEKEGGTGLGLAIASDLMRAQGGSIHLTSTGPAGTVFTLCVPAVSAAPGTPVRLATLGSSAAPPAHDSTQVG